MEFIPELIGKIDPSILEASAKGLATAIGKVAGETGIKLLGKTGEKILDGTGELTKAAQDLLFRISQKYINNYADRHGTLKVLGMGKPVSLDSVYTKVNFKTKAYHSLDTREEAFRQRENETQQKQSGIKVANQTQYLMVLGDPGMGKTTFLRKLGLEALKGKKQGEYQHNCIPVLLELRSRKFQSGKIDLVKAIATEFQNCGLPEYQECTEKLLEQGKLLILLDGLDEVPSDRTSEMTAQIRDLLDKYNRNRFVVSCRIAAYRNFDSFRRFTDVVIANFDDEQIETFIGKWFESHDQPEWGQQCWEKLKSGDYRATKELTKTPLLLTLICILFRKTGQFPTNRATLYERTLRVLLEEWDASKEITRHRIYQGLDTKRKELMLAQVAYENLMENCLFFSGREIGKQIELALAEMLPEEKYLDGREILREIEVQHGILIKRDTENDTYSFSHLTLQEYLTALHIVENEIEIEPLLDQYLYKKSWREVWLILAGLRKADNLLLAMERKIHGLMNTPKLQDLLTWVEQITDPSSGDIQPLGKRAISLANGNALAIANTYANVNALANTYVLTNIYAKTYGNALANGNALAIANTYANVNAFPNTYALNNIYAKAYAIKQFINYAQWSEQYQIYQSVNHTKLIANLEELKTKISDNQPLGQICQTFFQELIQTVLSAFQLSPKRVDLSKSELETLNNYFYANWLMIQCKDAAVKYSPITWANIESRMLLPAKNNHWDKN